MDYPFENLGPEKFQLLCQSLLVKEYPSTLCMPVGQPDGGRDAIQLDFGSNFNEYLVFQVKYARQPLAEKDPREWLIDKIRDEIPKVKKLITIGLKCYVLITKPHDTS